MPLTSEQRELKKQIYNSLVDKALEPDDERYTPIYKLLDCQDPIARIKEHIELTDNESTQFFSGFRGSGKTTELLRLQRELLEEGYLVVYADALKYINPSDEIDITDLLIIIAGAFSDALREGNHARINIDSYWTRFTNWLVNTNISVPEVTAKAGAEGFEAQVKANLKTAPTFRQTLQKELTNRIGELKTQVDTFVEDGVKAVRTEMGEDTKIVFIFDSLEQIRGSLFNEQEVIKSVERVFSRHHRLLELPYIHTIYTVPPWLKMVMPNSPKPIVILHSPKQWENDSERSDNFECRKVFRKLVVKRFGENGFKEFFGQEWNAETKTKADELINLCGGHFRDLLSLLREAVLPTQAFPISENEIKAAIANVRSRFLPISQDDADGLERIAESRSLSDALPNISGGNVGKVARYLDTHMVLYFRNGDDWYDIHPLIHEEVSKIAARMKTKAAEDAARDND
jgi:DNA polymerase III delta prime subunit